MQPDEVKEAVRQHYTEVVRAGTTCCGGGCGSGSAEDLTAPMTPAYEGQDSDILATANLGLGCGDPVRFSGLVEGMTVLDLGSGGGIDVFLSAKEVGASGRAIGLDMTDEMLERAESNRSKLGLWNTMFVRGEIESIPLPSGSVDRVISNCVINLVPDKRKAFREIFRVMRKGGTFVVSDIVTDGVIPETMRKDPELWAGCVSGALDRTEYLGIVREAGFEGVEILVEKKSGGEIAGSFVLSSITVRGRKPDSGR